MAKINRELMKVFGQDAGANQFGKIGSLASGTPETTTSISEIQSYANYLAGWFSCVVGNNSPAIEDMNSLCHLFAYQLAYIFQSGCPEWNVETEYYVGSMVSQDGVIFISLQDNNLGNALTDETFWRTMNDFVIDVTASVGSVSMNIAKSGAIFFVETDAALTINLPSPKRGMSFSVVDKTGNADSFPITINRNGSEKIQNLAANFICEAPYGSWKFVSDGTDWFIQ